MRGLPGSITRSMAPVESLRASTRCHVLPPSAERYTPRMGLGPNTCPNAAAYTRSALPGCTTILAICPASRSPARDHVLPPSVERNRPSPGDTLPRSVCSPVPTYTTLGSASATATAPIEPALSWPSPRGRHDRPPSVVFQTPPPVAPK